MTDKIKTDTPKVSTPVTHYVNLWLRSNGAFELGGRCTSLEKANTFGNLTGDAESKRICILKVTTIVEVA